MISISWRSSFDDHLEQIIKKAYLFLKAFVYIVV